MSVGLRRGGRIELPFDAIRDNVIYGQGSAAAVYRVDTRSFAFLSEQEKIQLHARLAWWMLKVQADFSIYRVCRAYPADLYVQDTVSLIDERVADRARWESLLAAHAEHMRSMRSFTPEVYFVVSLRSADRPPWARLAREASVIRDAERAALETLCDQLPARRAHTHEIQWALVRAAVRGVREPEIDPHWYPPALALDGGVWEAGRADVQRFMSTLTERSRTLDVEGEDGESLQAVLALGKVPRRSDYPGAAELLFAPLESLAFPVDAVAHVRWMPNSKMRKICDNAVKDASNEIEDALGRFLDRKTHRRGDEVAAVQDYFASEPYPPALETCVSLAVAAEPGDHKLLADRVKRLRRAYGSVRLYQPHALQRSLYADHLLRPDGASVRDYRQLLTREQLAAMMPIGAHAGGSDRGIYLGYTIPGARRPVKSNPLEAAERGVTGAMLLDGTLGSGKTIAVQQLAYQAAKRGSIVVDIDPKHPVPDHALDALPGLQGLVHQISLTNVDEHRGRLDPLVVAPQDMREELASSYMMEILPQATPEWQTEIIDSVRAVLRGDNPSSWAVVERLLGSDDPHANAAGKALRVWAEWGLGKLAFSHGETMDVHTELPVTMIKASSLTLPPAGTARSSYDQAERVSVATLKLIVARAMRMLSVDRSVHKMLVIDEAHVLADTVDGRRFLERVIRMGRYMNITIVLASQLLGDLADLGQLIGIRFVFRQETDEQASANLRMLGLDGDDRALIDMLVRTFEKGMCLMRGLDGRVVAMRFDPADPEFLRVLNTDPLRASIEQLEEALTA